MIEVLKQAARTALVSTIVRAALYAMLMGAVSYGMLWGAVVYKSAFYDELYPVETLETVFALAAALMFLLAGRQDASRRPCAIVFAGFLFCTFIRESDFILDTWVGRHSWKVGVALIAAGTVLYIIKNFRSLYDSVLTFICCPSFGIFLSGLLMLLVFSRLFGCGLLWRSIMLDDVRYHIIKKIVEEGIEQTGYFLLLMSSCEYLHEARVQIRAARKVAE